MVLFVDLENEEKSSDLLDPRQSSGFANLEHHILNGDSSEASAFGEERPNPNRNGFAAILSCYP
jgi:hypothetical protein